MSLSATVLQSVQTAKVALGDLLLTGTLVKKTGNTYNTATQENVKTTQNYSIDFVYDQVDIDEIRELQLKSSDLKIILLDVPVVPDNGDTFVIDGLEYQVYRAKPTKAGLVDAICTVYLRR